MADGRVLAIDFGATKIALALADLDGTQLGSVTLDTEPERGARQALERTLAAACDLTHERELSAVGAVTPGIIEGDHILLAPNVPGWEQLALGPLLRRRLGAQRVALANDVKAGALAEARSGSLADVDNGVFLNVGTGLAAAIVLQGRIVTGAHGAAGEIGYSLHARPGGPAYAEGHAPLEELVSGRALAQRASALLGRPVTTAEVFIAAEDPLRGLLNEALEVLAVHITNLTIVLDPARIALGGGLTNQADTLLPFLRGVLDRAVPFPPELVLAHHKDAPLAGALILALDAARSNRRAATRSGATDPRHVP